MTLSKLITIHLKPFTLYHFLLLGIILLGLLYPSQNHTGDLWIVERYVTYGNRKHL